MPTRIYNPTNVSKTRRMVDTQDFMVVIPVGYGESLYPFNEGTNVLSKALMPVGNVPIINLVLDWVFNSGLTDILMIVPPAFHSSISNHLAENYSSATHSRARIDLKRYTDGEKDDDEDQSESTGRGAKDFANVKEGTARLLRRFRSHIKSDFVLLPCDLAPPPYLSLASILDKHRASPDAVLTSVFYEPIEAVKEEEEKILVAMDKETNQLLLVEPLEGMDEDLELRMSLIASHPSLSLSTRLLDAHIYVFRRTVLDLLATRRPRDLANFREQFVPWLLKGSWQKGLGERWASILNPPRRDPFAAALARSTMAPPTSSSHLYDLSASSPSSDHVPSFPPTVPTSPRQDSPSSMSGSAAFSAAAGAMAAFPGKKSSKKATWKCQYVLAVPPAIEAEPAGKGNKGKAPAAAEPHYLIRANSLAGYWELNRRFLRTMPPVISTPAQPAIASIDGTAQAPLITPTAQISPDSLLGEGTRVGDRASIKKCVVGRHCNIGRGAKITGCVLWDFVTVEENARIENAILCSNVRIGEKASVKDCEFGTGFEATPGAILKGERLVAGQEA